MYRLDKTRFLNDAQNPSFSSTLLDKIYRSIDEGERKSTADVNFYTQTMAKKQSRTMMEKEEKAASLRRLEKWMDSKATQKEHWKTPTNGKSHRHNQDHDQDVVFFSSTSSSSDSSSGLLSSSSDTESMYAVRSRVSCFAPSKPKPVSEKKRIEEEGLIKSKSRALKIYNNLKKVKQPISPGGKLGNFLNSLFTAGNTKKTKTTSSFGQPSTCSSVSSFSRSCLSVTSPSSRDKLRNGVKRTVRFYPVSVIVDEDSRPCGHKCLYEEKQDTALPLGKKKDQEFVVGKSKRVEEAARDFLKEYRRNQKSDLVFRDFPNEDDNDDDAASCSSSDLFELDHLALMRNDRYSEELPVYETTHVSTNRAIANGLIM